MTNISQRLEQVVKKELSKLIIPVKTQEGILVGDILIKNNGSLKNIVKNGNVLYKEISLNKAAIAIANLLALKKSQINIDNIYAADQEYGKWFSDSQLLRSQYEKASNQQDFDRADMLWARYQESRNRTTQAKKTVERLAVF
jgi:hypothetical protein